MPIELQGLGRHIHELLVLAQLKRGPMHGYELARRVREQSAGSVVLHHGTLYPILHRLERQRLIRSEWRETGERRRRIYSLTHAGASHLRESTGKLKGSFTQLLHILSDSGSPVRL
ncbi:MAG TPA: helix-turn-helix transcriptional regulator [Longimicrobiales bacterium]